MAKTVGEKLRDERRKEIANNLAWIPTIIVGALWLFFGMPNADISDNEGALFFATVPFTGIFLWVLFAGLFCIVPALTWLVSTYITRALLRLVHLPRR